MEISNVGKTEKSGFWSPVHPLKSTFFGGGGATVETNTQHNRGFLPDIVLLALCFYHYRETRLDAMKRFALWTVCTRLKKNLNASKPY